MKNVEDPFADKQNKVVAKEKPSEIDVGNIINRLAEIEDELSRRGIDPLIKEKDILRKTLKDYMTTCDSEMEYDEVSNHESVLVQRFKDSWSVPTFEDMLSPSQCIRYIEKSVAEGAVKDGIKNGDLSRAELEAKGAVVKKPGAKALYVRARKQEDDA